MLLKELKVQDLNAKIYLNFFKILSFTVKLLNVTLCHVLTIIGHYIRKNVKL